MPSYKAPLTAVLVYAPELTAQALEQAVEALGKVQRLVSVVPLPAGAGDRIPLPGLTTGGTTDVMAISALRILLPAETRVRASWAALGWKVAQVALAYGADEIAGWTAAETLAYTGRVRAASRVERQELNEGLEEARCRDAGWSTIPYGETL
jgi:2-iminoacetate synthase ThiH